MKAKTKKRILITVSSVLAVIILIVGSYLLYVVLSYHRVEDNLKLDVMGNAEAVAPAGESLTLVTYNIGFGAYSDDYSFFMDGGEHSRAFSKDAVLQNIGGALEAIQKINPDFVLLQEVDVEGTRSYGVDQTKIFADGFKNYDYIFAENYDSPYFLYPFSEPIGANRSGLMTFSRYNIDSALRRSLPIEESLYKYLDLDRAYSVSRIKLENGRELILYNVHLSAYTSDGSISTEQLKMLLADMKAEYEKGNYCLAAGDFNKDMLGDSGEYFIRAEGENYTWAKPFENELLPEGFKSYTGSNVPTCRNADAPFRGDGTDFVLSVDGMLVSDNIEVVLCETVDVGFKYSDHNPVKTELVLIP